MSFPRYAKYKDSGTVWLGQAPEHWEVIPLKRTWSVTDCKHITAEFVDEGIPLASIREVQSRYVNLEDAKQTTDHFYQMLIDGERKPEPGDLILSRNATVGEVAQVRTGHPPFAMGQDVCLLTKHEREYSSDFLQYVMRSQVVTEQFAILLIGSTFKRVNVEEIRNLMIPIPPSREQAAIASFLDRETEKIDGLVGEQRRLIELLKEKRQAVISHAVTKGLNPHAPMKPSGIQWLGNVPAHWEVVPFKRVIERVESGTSVNASDFPAEDGKFGVLKTSCVYTGQFDPNENKTVVEGELDRVSCPLRAGTLIVSRMNTPELVGAAGLVRQAPPNLFLPDRLWQVSLNSRQVDVEFAYHWTLSDIYRSQIKAACTGTSSSMKNLGQGDFGNFVFITPPLNEQTAIVSWLTTETAKFDALTAEAQRAIDLLQERRTALISAAVTGKIDVRGLAESEAA